MNTYAIEENDGLFTLQSPNDYQIRIAPQFGFNAYSFRIPHRGEQLRVLVEPENDEKLHGGGFSFGYPILWPFANRIRDGKYSFEGEDYQLDINFKDGNAIHGLVCNRAWKVVGQGTDDQSAWISAQFDTRLDADVLRQYPFEAVITATYRLQNESLVLETRVENVGDKNLPMSFGIHPWFPMPLTPLGRRNDCILKLPADSRWELEVQSAKTSSTQLVPTGEIVPVNGDAAHDFRDGKTLGEQFLDDVWTQLDFGDDVHACYVVDPHSGLKIEVESSPASSFREYVVYAPLDDDIICLEPYSSTTDAPNLQNRGIDAGLVVLAPQQRWRCKIALKISQI